MEVLEFKNKKAYLDTVKFKTKDQKFLGRRSIFTPIPLNAQYMWSLNQFYVFVSRENIKESLLTYMNIQTISFYIKFCMFLFI